MYICMYRDSDQRVSNFSPLVSGVVREEVERGAGRRIVRRKMIASLGGSPGEDQKRRLPNGYM